MEGVHESFSGQTLLAGNLALAGALQRISGERFLAPVQSVSLSDNYDDAPYGDEYGDAPDDYVDTTYSEDENR